MESDAIFSVDNVDAATGVDDSEFGRLTLLGGVGRRLSFDVVIDSGAAFDEDDGAFAWVAGGESGRRVVTFCCADAGDELVPVGFTRAGGGGR